ncbi:MAG: response regulator transcription factor [Oscillospiraceae bacterium]|nr:response regulator transcription factor [Oscillospiraceae bacterium]
MKLNIFIADDDSTITDQLSKIIKEWSARTNNEINLLIKNGLNEVTPVMVSPFDLVILDIMIGDANGIEFAKSLRKIGSDASIAFITNFVQFAVDGYSVHAVSYLLKPLDPVSVEQLLEESLTMTGDFSSGKIKVYQNGKYKLIAIKSIIFIEVLNKHLIVHLIDKEETYYMSFSALEPQLSGSNLVRCHRSYIINLEFVREMTSSAIDLYGISQPIPVGRSYLSSVKERLFRKRSVNNL